MNKIEKRQLRAEIQHIFDSGANEIRIFEMVKSFIEKRTTMTMRDKFAAKAMQSMITAFYKKNTKEDPLEMFKILKLISKNSYWFADEMINKREKK